mmetsp:Transcript_94127/g.130734  ORF Transcript_94127/g.130734 Transcript_94127/m.130734 type:complete len:171 (+) Transcript_94127:31-543(+)
MLGMWTRAPLAVLVCLVFLTGADGKEEVAGAVSPIKRPKGVAEETPAEQLADLRRDLAAAEAQAAEAEAKKAAAQHREAQAEHALDETLHNEAIGEVYGAFFAGLFLLAAAAGVIWLRHGYQVQAAQQMSTIVSLNEERVKILTRLNQQTQLQKPAGAAESLSKPLLPKG